MAVLNRQKARELGYNDEQIDRFLSQTGIQEKKTLGGFVSNIAKSGARTIGDIGSAAINVFNPNLEKNTLANLGRVGVGAAQTLIPGNQGKNEEMARGVGKFYKDRYGGLDEIGNTLYRDPVGSLLDVSAVVGGAGALARGAGSLGKVGGLTRAGNALTRAGAAIDPFYQAGKMAGAGTSRLTRGMAGKLDDLSDTAITRGMGQPAQLQKIQGRAGRSVADIVKDYKLVGAGADEFSDVKRALGKEYTQKALKSGTQANVGTFVKAVDDEIAKVQKLLAQRPNSTALQTQLETLLQNKQDFLKRAGATSRQTPLTTPTARTVRFRRALDADVPQSAFAQATLPPGQLNANVATRRALKGTINEAVPELGQMGRDLSAFGDEYGRNKGLIQMVKQAEARGKSRNLLGAGRLFSTTAGGVAGGFPGALGGFFADYALNSPKGRTVISEASELGAKGLRGSERLFSGAAKVTGGIYGSGKVGRVFSSPGKTTTLKEKSQRDLQYKQQLSHRPGNSSEDIIAEQSKQRREPIFRLKTIKRRGS